MIHYYQILISINTKAIEEFNKLLYEKLAPIKDEIVAKEFEDFDTFVFCFSIDLCQIL